MARDLPHILVPGTSPPERYRPHARGGKSKTFTPADPALHGRTLRAAFEHASTEAKERRTAAAVSVAVPGAKPGIGVVFTSPPGIPLKLDGLDLRGSKVELLGVRTRTKEDGAIEEMATVFVPDGKVAYFLKRFDEYVSETTPKGARKHRALVETLASIQLATLTAFWTDEAEAFPPDDQSMWWEVWLRRTDGKEEERLHDFARALNLDLGARRLTFPDRVVRTLRATPLQLGSSIDVLGDIAELRRARDAPSDFVKMPITEQADWVRDLSDRLDPAPDGAPAVCVLDTGVNRGHPLLSASLVEADTHAVDPSWQRTDHDGHGSEMAGLALLGDLRTHLLTTDRVVLRHRLESVKILPPTGTNPPDLWGTVTAEGVARPEVTAPARQRVFSMSVATLDGSDRGRPTSWSAAVDGLAAGRALISRDGEIEFLDRAGTGPARLLVVCAGNVDTTEVDHITRSDLETIRDPGQAWNALTVGASTHLVDLDETDPKLRGYRPVAAAGDLSPYSSTSVGFSGAWPIKPDVVFEGGNKAHDGHAAMQLEELSLASTYWKPSESLLESTWGTSAATAQVARIAATVMSDYPDLWPETVRALVVHSAEWTKAMKQHAVAARKRSQRERFLLRRFGFGEPSELRAAKSAKNALTLIVQDTIKPFENTKLREMKVHELPWPTDALLALAAAPVTMRVTLSYFIEPNPARRGWRTRYRYASHGLRFDVMKPTETVDLFRQRLNELAVNEEDGGDVSSESDAANWFLGPDLRHHGSLHGDFWDGSAADLALRGAVGVFPVSGWWKDQPKHDRSELGVRYALIVSITTPETDVDLWTPVAAQVGVAVPTTVVI